MRKLLLSWAMMLAAVTTVMAQGEIAITTTLPEGTEFIFNPTVVSGTVSVDWGDGNLGVESTQINEWGGNIGYKGTVKGPQIRIVGNFSRIDLTEKEITKVAVSAEPSLTYLSLAKNKIEGRLGYETSSIDLSGAPNLSTLDLSYNNLEWAIVKDFKSLQTLYIGNNPILNSLYICDEGDKQANITTINAADCDITHFWPRNLPNLSSLNLSNNSLWDIEIADHYPSLWILTLSGNTQLTAVDVSKCAELGQLFVSNTAISDLNISQCPELQYVDAANTNISKLNVKNNTQLRNLNVSNTNISTLDVSQLEALRSIYVDNTQLRRLDLRMKRYLQYVSVAGTDIEWLDMHHCVGYNTLRSLDLRNCKKMTRQTLNYTFDAMPPHNGASYQANVFLEGTAYEHACTGLLDVDGDNYYKPDFEGDGRTADLKEEATLTELPATGGTYKLQKQEQWGTTGSMPEWGSYSQYLPFVDITGGKVWAGRPVRVTDIQPEEGYEFAGIEVNGEFIADHEFQLSADGTVKVIFRAAAGDGIIKLTTAEAGISQQYFLGADEDNTEITVDWGDGSPVSYTIGKGMKYVGVDEEEGQTTSGTTITIRGAVTRAIFDSYPFVATDNLITGIDLSGTSRLRELSTYMNEIETLDVSGQPDLETLDVSYSELDELNISANPKLTQLRAYGNYLSAIDLSHAPGLTYIDLKGNMLTELDVTANTLVDTLIVQNNDIATLDVAPLTKLEHLEVWGNKLAALDVTNAPNLMYLAANGNQLTTLDLSKNPYLMGLNISANHLEGLDVSQNQWLYLVNVSQNGWDACTLNEFYKTLCDYPLTDQQIQDYEVGTALRVNSYSYASTSEYPNNQYETSNTSLATTKRWSIDYTGDGTATCGEAAIETVIDAEAGSMVDIYDLQGNLRYSGRGAEGMAISLPRGVYVVRSGKESKKIVVK